MIDIDAEIQRLPEWVERGALRSFIATPQPTDVWGWYAAGAVLRMFAARGAHPALTHALRPFLGRRIVSIDEPVFVTDIDDHVAVLLAALERLASPPPHPDGSSPAVEAAIRREELACVQVALLQGLAVAADGAEVEVASSIRHRLASVCALIDARAEALFERDEVWAADLRVDAEERAFLGAMAGDGCDGWWRDVAAIVLLPSRATAPWTDAAARLVRDVVGRMWRALAPTPLVPSGLALADAGEVELARHALGDDGWLTVVSVAGRARLKIALQERRSCHLCVSLDAEGERIDVPIEVLRGRGFADAPSTARSARLVSVSEQPG